jgi:hypothetical protein
MDEWTSSAGDSARKEHLTNGGGLNGTVKLNVDAVREDSSVDRVSDVSGSDLLLRQSKEKVTDGWSFEWLKALWKSSLLWNLLR